MPSAELCHWKVAAPYPVEGFKDKLGVPEPQNAVEFAVMAAEAGNTVAV